MPLSDIGIIVEKYINTSYDVVKTVYDNLAAVRTVSGYLLLQDTVLAAEDETIVSNLALQNDDELFMALAANCVYHINAWIKFTCASTTPNAKVHFTVPAGATWDGTILFHNAGEAQVATPKYYSEAVSEILLSLDGTNDGFLSVDLTVVTGSTAGNITFQFAQQVSDANVLTRKANSWLKTIKVT